MENNEVKHEFGGDSRLQCRACLSVGRILRPLQDLAKIYKKITSECLNNDSLETVQICWQCSSLLKKAVLFQEQVKRADELLQTNQTFIYGPLSNLISVTINDAHQIIYAFESDIQTNKETSENISNKNEEQAIANLENSSQEISENDLYTEIVDYKLKKTYKSRWALKRAQQNKKPKFKVSTDFNETFKRIHISNEELVRCIDREKDSEYYNSKRFKCKYCVTGFSDSSFLLKHNQKLHNKNAKYTCDICKSKISSKRHLLFHLSKHYFVFKCIICQFVCRKELRSWHFKKEHKKVLQCLKCHLQFGSRRDFFRHYKECHERFICDYCGICFKMKYCIKDHIKKQHSPYECAPCGKKFARYNSLWLHKKLAHHPARPAYCAECDLHYRDAYRLRWHLCNSVKHTPRNKVSIPCPSCDKIFSKKIYMRDHHNLVHLKLFKYRCEDCDKNFIRNADLIKHKKKIHDGILPPKNKICYICGRGFTTNKILQNHIRTHTGERPFACACGATFAQRAAASAHAKKHAHQMKETET